MHLTQCQKLNKCFNWCQMPFARKQLIKWDITWKICLTECANCKDSSQSAPARGLFRGFVSAMQICQVWKKKKHLGTPPCSSAILKGHRFFNFLFASWTMKTFLNGVANMGKMLSKKQILSRNNFVFFKCWPPLKMEEKIKIAKLLPLKIYPLTFKTSFQQSHHEHDV